MNANTNSNENYILQRVYKNFALYPKKEGLFLGKNDFQKIDENYRSKQFSVVITRTIIE